VLALHLLILAILQGISELFPISSLGHSILVPAVLRWSINRDAPWFLPYIVLLHLGTATALFIYFRRDWFRLLSGTWKARAMSPIRRRDCSGCWYWPPCPRGSLVWLWNTGSRRVFGGFLVGGDFLC